MFSALLSFLGGSAFRMLWGEISSWANKKQDHKFEIERMRLQQELDNAEHARNLESLKLQSDLGIKTIQVQADAAISKIDAEAFAQAVADVGKPTGIRLLDVWNGSIRPMLATIAAYMLIQETIMNNFSPTAHVLYICDAILGIYVADRSLAKRGK